MLSQIPFFAYADQQMSGINQIGFFDSQYDKAFVGNGFLIRHKNKVYAVTVKHALFEAKTPDMTHINLAPHVKEWRIHPNKSADQYVKLGRLLNADESEKIDMQILQKDWLVFEVEQNNSNLAILELRQSPVKKGEQLTAYGCSYAEQATCKQSRYTGTFSEYDNQNLRVLVENLDMGKLRGLSGSPVLDERQRVVGIVSNVLKAKSGQGFDFAPASLEYLNEVLDIVH